MAGGAANGQSRADGQVGVEIAGAVPFMGALALRAGEFALEQLPPAAYGSGWIALDDEDGGSGSQRVPASRADLLGEGFCEALIGVIRGHGFIDKLAPGRRCEKKRSQQEDG
jgi:hypothetical protein